MTLILTRASKNYVLQVTDRLVTRGRAPSDTLANKNILYCARNAIVTIGYTGLGYLDEMPTDQWIVEKLTGKKTVYHDDKPAAFGSGKLEQWLDIGLSMRLLKTEFEKAATRAVRSEWRPAWKAQNFDLCVVGWQWYTRKRRFRPLSLALTKARGSTSFQVVEEPRYWHFRGDRITEVPKKRFVFKLGAAPAENIQSSDLRELLLHLEDKRSDEAEAVMVNCIRDAAETLPVVGRDCISIVLLPPPTARGRVRYMPATRSEAILTSKTERTRLPAAFSPWLVGPNSVWAPSIMGGTCHARLGFYEIAMEGPELPGPGVLGYMGGLHRPNPDD